MALTFVSWRLIQTERFGTFISNRVHEVAQDKLGVNVLFERVELSLFPISTKLINVKVEKDKYNIEAGDISLVFGLRDIFAKKFSIGKIVLNETILKLPKIEPSQNNEKFSLEDHFDEYQKYVFGNAPIVLRGLEVYNSILDYDNITNDIYALELNLYKNIITLSLNTAVDNKLITELAGKDLKLPTIDGVNLTAQITRENIRLKEVKIFSDLTTLDISTTLDTEGKVGEGKLKGFIELDKIKDVVPKGTVNLELLPSGGAEIELEFDKVSPMASFKGSFKGKKLTSSFYRIDELDGVFRTEGDQLLIDSLVAKVKNGEAQVNTPFAVLNLNSGKFINPKFDLKLKNMYSNNFLFFVDGLTSTKFYAEGVLGVEFFDNHVLLNAKDKVILNNFKLLNKTETEEIVGNEKINLVEKGVIDIQFDGQVNLGTYITFKNSRVGIFGFVNKNGVNVDVGNSWIDFKELGPIVGTEIEGKGDVTGKIVGPLDDVVFDLNMILKEFKIVDFYLDNISGEMKHHLKNQLMELKQISGRHNSLRYAAEGSMLFDKTADNQLNMRVDISKGTLADARIALAPVVNPLKKYLDKVSFNFSSTLLVKGMMNAPQMRVKGRLNTSSVLIQNEDIDTIEGDFTLENNVIRWENLKAKKVSGQLAGESVYNLGSKEFTYRFSLSSLRLKDIQYYRLMSLGLDGEAFGDFYGVGEGNNFSSRSHIRVTNSTIENYKLNDSVLTIYNNNTDLFFSGTLIGGDASVEGYLNLNDDNKDKLSSITAKVKSNDVRILAGVFSQHNILNKDLKGKLESTIQVDFDINNVENINLIASLDDARLIYGGVDFELKNKPTIVEIFQGKFQNWDYTFSGKGINITSHGEGDISKDFKLVHKFQIDSSVLELINDKIENSYGVLRGEHIIFSSNTIKNYLTLTGEQLSLKAKKLPGLITNLHLDVAMDNNQLVLNSLKGSYGNGEIQGRGVVKLKFPYPEIDLKLNVEKTRFPLFKKSGVVLSGDLRFEGKKLPYDLSGDLAIISGEIIEETNDLASSAINNDSYQRYIPVGYLEGNVNFLKNNIRIVSFDPIKIKNSMMSLGLLGNVRVFGTLTTPKFNGDLSLNNSENKFLFKGHEFILSEGVIHFVDGARKESPELRFSGSAKINEYDVYINLTGPADSLVVEMTSNPPLVQGDILSLLTLGVTSDVSKNLGERQRQSVTTLSIGSLIMDQLKINQSLNDSLGLRLSVTPEFEEDETTLLEGKVDDSSSSSRLRSATVVKVQKRISKKVNLSVSSTVGGNIDASQEMNINYKINKAWSLEGVYEIKTNDELEQQIPDSIGGDVKYQWSF